MLRFLRAMWCRCGVDVSTLDTGEPPDLFHWLIVASMTTSPTPESRPSERLRSRVNLANFNRRLRDETGTTPTGYRRRKRAALDGAAPA